ncbi:hypothetical protein [Planctomicrobium sp. SH664]|uniref:hypothetical protein n=1 Tax=Planctomicrobium sp. SH664 TaxID=3448125 RepID=UPI003F5B3559
MTILPQHSPTDDNNSMLFRKIDLIVERVKRHAIEPEFSREVARREKKPDYDLPDDRVLKRMIELIAFSEGAQSKLVAEMLERGDLDRALMSYSPNKIAKLNPEIVIRDHWPRLSSIRFKKKITRMVECGGKLEQIASKHGSLMGYLMAKKLPNQITNLEEIDAFWAAFDEVQREFKAVKMPSFQNVTTLCHLLSDFGFDCAKPDSVVMGVAVKLGIVPDLKKHSDDNLREVVQTMQKYSISRNQRTPVIDLYFLIDGGQTEAKNKFVMPSYYTAS